MNEEPLEETYFKWLVDQVADVRQVNPRLSRWMVLSRLHHTEFVWRIRNDDNRVEDGREIRSEFANHYRTIDLDYPGCSFLEMLIALSRRLCFQTEGISVDEWFWHLMSNVGLDISDWEFENSRMAGFTDQVLKNLNNRTYDTNGRGGLFPLHDAGNIDLTKIELWYQMNYYLLERR